MDSVKEFLRSNWDRKSPLLLGYSGGPDSKALLYLLLELGYAPHLAHVDHGWREESRKEAEALKLEAEKLNLPFHTVRLEPDRREVVAREKRFEFFTSLFEKIPFQALLLAHQADDLAETALKRVLEGANLIHLGSMRGVSKIGPLTIWRPLLNVPRSDLERYLEKKKLDSIQDATNLDPAYLRARMRVQILPELSRSFGKEVSANLTTLGNRANELKDYLDRRTDGSLSLLQKGPWGLALPLSTVEPVEIRHLLQRTGITLTRPILEGVTDALAKRLPNRKFGQKIVADRGWFFSLANRFPQFGDPVPVKKGIYRSGDWLIEIGEEGSSESCSWQTMWSGKFSLTLPNGNYVMETPKSLNRVRKGMNERAIPAFLRPFIPQISLNGEISFDLLADRKPSEGNGALQVRIFIDSTNSTSEG